MKSRWLLPTGPRIGIESTFDLSELSDGFSALIHSHSSLLPNIRGCSSAAAGFVSRFTLERPWYQWAGIDFITENLVRSEFRDERLVEFKLTPLRLKTNKELVDRGNQLRQRVRQGIVTTVPVQPRNLRTLYPQPRVTTPANRTPRPR